MAEKISKEKCPYMWTKKAEERAKEKGIHYGRYWLIKEGEPAHQGILGPVQRGFQADRWIKKGFIEERK